MKEDTIDDFPIGLFQIILENGEYIIKYCNKHYASLLGCKSPTELIGKKASVFHYNEQCTKNYYAKLKEQDLLKDHRLDSIDAYGKKRTFIIDCKKLTDSKGNVIGRSGVMHDISDLDLVKIELEMLQTDIGQLLHSYSSTLLLLKQTLEAVFESHSINVPKKKYSNRINHLENKKRVESVLSNVLYSFENYKNILSAPQKSIYDSVIHHFVDKLKEFENFDGRMINVVNLRALCVHILKLFIKVYRIPLEENILNSLTEVLRHTSLYVLDHSIDSVVDMDTDVDNFREWVTSGVRKEKEKEKTDLIQLTEIAIESLTAFSKRREIKILFEHSEREVEILCVKSDVYRAVFSIIHNAIKYSWIAQKGRTEVRLSIRRENKKVVFSAWNWGVKITQDELEENRLLKFGYRGIFSQDKNRPGTGIGLSDVNKVMKKHKGELIIESKPTQNPHYLTKSEHEIPNVTTVKLIFNG